MAPAQSTALHSLTERQLRDYLQHRRQRRTLSPGAALLWDDVRDSVLIPSAKIDYSQVTAIRMAARAKAQDAVRGTVGQTTVVRDFMAFDANNQAAGAARYARLSNRVALVAETWDVNDNPAYLLPNNKSIAIFGYEALSATPLIDAIRFTLGSVVALAIFALAPIYADMGSAIGYFDPPVFYAPGQSFQYDLLSEVAVGAGAEPFHLLGYVSEPGGTNVLPDQTNLV
jgi:hypothetical protein